MGHWALRVASHTRHGGGHLARAIVLAEALKASGETAVLLLDDDAYGAKEVAQRHGLSFCGVSDALDIRFSGVVLDGYEIIRHEAARWLEHSVPVAVIDDFLYPPDGASLVINGAPHLSGDEVRGIPALLGGRYALVDPIYATLPNRDRSEPVKRILVSFGRLDPDNLTARTLEALATLPSPPVVEVVLSSNSAHAAAVSRCLERLKNKSILTLDAPSLIEHLSRADLAIGAGGVSLLERMAAGVPSVSVAIIDNQRLFVEGAASLGGTIGVADATTATVEKLTRLLRNILSDTPKRCELAATGRRIVDGRGSERVAAELIKLITNRII